ncbi:O-methyltransferase [Enterococcus nangangensis]|uniref:O-methyltransferase n=1 Tax=Enterococcus nangangensis TaxID=2559926 RepID=UPI0010F8B834|nr:O-methyltransferase [Enterococcus nangangensis]
MRNEMMFRPVVNTDILEFMRFGQKPLTGILKEIQDDARKRNVPVIPHETVAFLQFYLRSLQAKNILEVGTAIGFSASLMATTLPKAHVTTIERYDMMAKEANETFAKVGITERVTLLEGQAADLLPTLPKESFDFIFMDSAKAKYVEFLPYCLELLTANGVLMIDDVFQAGTILKPIEEIPHKNHSIHRNLNKLFQTVHEDPKLASCMLPLGDGVLLVQKV